MDFKEKRMNTAQIYESQGFKQWEIAEKLGVTDRTVRNYLNKPVGPRKEVVRSSKLDPFKPFILSKINDRPEMNIVLLFNDLKRKQNYTGGISILRDYAKKLRDEFYREAVIRFETVPGEQAQVDWAVMGKVWNGSRFIKVYAFVMALGYSRKYYLRFTTSMTSGMLLECHKKAFRYFGGVPKEILYDNMKTAFVCDSEGFFHPNKRLLGFANHYGFMPKRCRIRRPQTKGKVERAIRFIEGNFWPRKERIKSTLDELNDDAMKWLIEIDRNKIGDMNESRNERFEREKAFLTPLPVSEYDCREISKVMVSRESMVRIDGNRYSLPAEYIGKEMTLLLNAERTEAELRLEGKIVRSFKLEEKGGKKVIWFDNDRETVWKMWHKQQNKKKQVKNALCEALESDIETRDPGFYDRITEGAA